MSPNRPWEVQSRELREVCTDPQRRCYYGAYAKSEMQWTEWGTLSGWPTQQEAEESAAGWRMFDFGGRKIEHRVFNKDLGSLEA